MKTLAEGCTPRASVFEEVGRDTVYDLADLDQIDAATFFAENYVTEGMRLLLEEGLKRLEGKPSSSGTFLLSQSMGGGKTHSLIALGLAAKYPEWRKRATEGFYEPGPLGSVRVVTFTGRQAHTPFGIWGDIAEQLNKRDVLKDFYGPLKPPGTDNWVDLLRGEPLLIMLDELPPYFEAAKAVPVGATHLDTITTTALANLLVAVASGKLPNVCIVLTDLRGSAYGSGSAAVSQALADLEKEVGRNVVRIDPVRINTNELYHILRVRLFSDVPSESDVAEVADGYRGAVEQAALMDLTTASPQQVRADVAETYPFDPAIRDLYARFKENPGFQQTRALIRIMRIAVANLWSSGRAEREFLIGAEDLDLHRQDLLSEIRQINPTLEVAIAHDIASEGGNSVAELIDAELGDRRDAQDAATLIFLSSLSQAVNPTLGLDRSDLVKYLAAPNRNVAALRDVLDRLQAAAWYVHPTSDGKLLFKNTENIVAKLDSYTSGMAPEVAREELREQLRGMFRPVVAACYQRIEALPELDKVQLEQDLVSLVVFGPSATSMDEIRRFWEHQQYPNRVGFLTGTGAAFETVLYRARELRAMRLIVDEMRREGRRDTDPQFLDAEQLRTRKEASFYQACRETFQTVLYPSGRGLTPIELDPKYVANEYRGEEQVLNALREAYKYREDTSPDGTFRATLESKLWPSEAKEVAWQEIKRRAATDPSWVWHHPRALDTLRDDLIKRDLWRQNGNFVERGPFERPAPTVSPQLLTRDDETGVATLRVRPLHGDTVFYSESGPPTKEAPRLESPDMKTNAVRVWFVAMDSADGRTGEVVEWTNTIVVKHRLFQDGSERRCELQAIPTGAIRFTLDGSAPQTEGAAYDAPFVVPPESRMVLAVAEADGVVSSITRFDLPRDGQTGVVIDPRQPATWRRTHRLDDTNASYTWLELAGRFKVTLGGVALNAARDTRWVEFRADETVPLGVETVMGFANQLKELLPDSNLDVQVETMIFESGADLIAFVREARLSIEAGEVIQ